MGKENRHWCGILLLLLAANSILAVANVGYLTVSKNPLITAIALGFNVAAIIACSFTLSIIVTQD